MVTRVQEQTVHSLRMRRFGRAERRSIVAAYLEGARSERCRTVHMPVHYKRRAMELAGIVRSYRRGNDDELEIPSRTYTQPRRCTDQQRPEIQCRAGSVRRYKIHVLLQCQVNRFAEDLFRHRFHIQSLCALRHPARILPPAEDTDLTVHSAERFQSLERLLSVLQTSGGYMQMQELVLGCVRFFPFAVMICRADNIVRFGIMKS